MLPVVTILKGVTELVLITMIGQAVLWILAGSGRRQNLIYGVFQLVTGPIFRFFRRITPRIVLDQHVPFVAFFWFVVFWVLLVLATAQLKGVIDVFA